MFSTDSRYTGQTAKLCAILYVTVAQSMVFRNFRLLDTVLPNIAVLDTITGSGRLEGTTVGHLVQPPCSSRVILEHMAQNHIQTVPESSPVREIPHHLWTICSSA